MPIREWVRWDVIVFHWSLWHGRGENPLGVFGNGNHNLMGDNVRSGRGNCTIQKEPGPGRTIGCHSKQGVALCVQGSTMRVLEVL